MVFRGSAISRVIEGFPASSREEGSAHEKRKRRYKPTFWPARAMKP